MRDTLYERVCEFQYHLKQGWKMLVIEWYFFQYCEAKLSEEKSFTYEKNSSIFEYHVESKESQNFWDGKVSHFH